MTILGLRGINSKISENVKKIMSADESGKHKLSLAFRKTNLSEGINQLFKYGLDQKNYF